MIVLTLLCKTHKTGFMYKYVNMSGNVGHGIITEDSRGEMHKTGTQEKESVMMWSRIWVGLNLHCRSTAGCFLLQHRVDLIKDGIYYLRFN
jgi:hypothetical protein